MGRLPALDWVLRIAYLAALAALSVLLLTAAQISYAFLEANGGGNEVSAVAIRDTARLYEDNRISHLETLNAVAAQQKKGISALALTSDATLFQYFHKVQFRRFIFGCYPGAYQAVRTAGGKESEGKSEMSWDFLLLVYQQASGVTDDTTTTACSMAMKTNSAAVEALKSSALEYKGLFKDCSGEMAAKARLECLWDNVTDGVGLEEMTIKYRSSLDADLKARRGEVANLNNELAGEKALAVPAGRAAVAAWLSLNGGSGNKLLEENPSGGRAEVAQQSFWGAVRDVPGRLIAFIAIMPILAQSAVLAMSAGALGGGVARLWEMLGYRRKEPEAVLRAADEIAALRSRIDEALPTAGPADQDELSATRATMEALGTALEQARSALAAFRETQLSKEGAPVTVATFCGAIAALFLWLLTTSGLFVLTGGDNAASASPNVLLAIALTAGLVHGRVINLIFSWAETKIQ